MTREEREREVLALAETHGLTIEQVGTRIMYDLLNGVPGLAEADHLMGLWDAYQRLRGNGHGPVGDGLDTDPVEWHELAEMGMVILCGPDDWDTDLDPLALSFVEVI